MKVEILMANLQRKAGDGRLRKDSKKNRRRTKKETLEG